MAGTPGEHANNMFAGRGGGYKSTRGNKERPARFYP